MQVSQSERLVWLCEELQIPYKLVLHQRDPLFSPESIKKLSPLGQAPVIQDGDLTLAESAACVEYIIHKHGNGKFALPPSHKNYADYLYWFHFSNGTFQPQVLTLMQAAHTGTASPYAAGMKTRYEKMLSLIDARVAQNTWLAGDELTAADIMIVFTLTTMRTFYPVDFTEYKGILAYLQRVVQREGYKKARAKGDPQFELEFGFEAKPPRSFLEKLKAEGKV